jgi:DNA-binding transcriptional ArsR family regulator
MSQKNKRGLQRGLSDIVEKQTAPVADKSQESSSLIAKFRDHPLPPPPTTSPLQPETKPIAPVRDFARVANSITRDAIPAGLFKGTSKKLYDALYLRTRGAIVPIRQVKARQGDLMQWAGVSHNTLRTHLRSLEAVGLIEIRWELGDNDGAVYEVRLPEEIDLLPPPTTSLQPPPSSNQKLVPPSNQKLEVGGGGQLAENKTVSGQPKTLIKTNTERSDDDAALAGLINELKSASKEITGREVSASESERWRELAAVLIAELRIAAARTTVSSVPAFLAEHLRRRLWKIDKKQAHAEGRELPDEPGSQTFNVDASTCPDCSGSGWWYPEGETKGVAKCKHAQLSKVSEGEIGKSD